MPRPETREPRPRPPQREAGHCSGGPERQPRGGGPGGSCSAGGGPQSAEAGALCEEVGGGKPAAGGAKRGCRGAQRPQVVPAAEGEGQALPLVPLCDGDLDRPMLVRCFELKQSPGTYARPLKADDKDKHGPSSKTLFVSGHSKP